MWKYNEKVHTGKDSENEMASVLENKTELAEVLSAFIEEEQISGQCHGYRWVHQKSWLNEIVSGSWGPNCV